MDLHIGPAPASIPTTPLANSTYPTSKLKDGYMIHVVSLSCLVLFPQSLQRLEWRVQTVQFSCSRNCWLCTTPLYWTVNTNIAFCLWCELLQVASFFLVKWRYIAISFTEKRFRLHSDAKVAVCSLHSEMFLFQSGDVGSSCPRPRQELNWLFLT